MAMNRLMLSFQNVPASQQFQLSIYQGDAGVWSVGTATETEGGLQIKSGQTGTPVQFQSLVISAKQIIVYAGSELVDVNIAIFVSTTSNAVSGEATLPGGANCLITSDADQTNVIASGSWGVRLS